MLNRLVSRKPKTQTGDKESFNPPVPYFANGGIPDGPQPCPHCLRDLNEPGGHRCLQGRCPNGTDHTLGMVTAYDASNKVLRKPSSKLFGKDGDLPSEATTSVGGGLLKKPSRGFMRLPLPPPGLGGVSSPVSRQDNDSMNDKGLVEESVPLLECGICLKRQENKDAVMHLCDRCPFRLCERCKTQLDQFPNREQLERIPLEYMSDTLLEIFSYSMSFEKILIQATKFAYLYDYSAYLFLVKLLDDDLIPYLAKGKRSSRQILSQILVWACWGPGAGDNAELETARFEQFNVLLATKHVDPAYNNNAALIVACANGRLNLVQRLVKARGVDPRAQNSESLRVAAAGNHDNIVQFLLKGKQVDARAALDGAIAAGSLNLAGQLLHETERKKKSRSAELLRMAGGITRKGSSTPKPSRGGGDVDAIEVIWEATQTGADPRRVLAEKKQQQQKKKQQQPTRDDGRETVSRPPLLVRPTTPPAQRRNSAAEGYPLLRTATSPPAMVRTTTDSTSTNSPVINNRQNLATVAGATGRKLSNFLLMRRKRPSKSETPGTTASTMATGTTGEADPPVSARERAVLAARYDEGDDMELSFIGGFNPKTAPTATKQGIKKGNASGFRF